MASFFVCPHVRNPYTTQPNLFFSVDGESAGLASSPAMAGGEGGEAGGAGGAPPPRGKRSLVARGHHAPAFGAVCRALGIGGREAARAFMFLVARDVMSAATRCVCCAPDRGVVVVAEYFFCLVFWWCC